MVSISKENYRIIEIKYAFNQNDDYKYKITFQYDQTDENNTSISYIYGRRHVFGMLLKTIKVFRINENNDFNIFKYDLNYLTSTVYNRLNKIYKKDKDDNNLALPLVFNWGGQKQEKVYTLTGIPVEGTDIKTIGYIPCDINGDGICEFAHLKRHEARVWDNNIIDFYDIKGITEELGGTEIEYEDASMSRQISVDKSPIFNNDGPYYSYTQNSMFGDITGDNIGELFVPKIIVDEMVTDKIYFNFEVKKFGYPTMTVNINTPQTPIEISSENILVRTFDKNMDGLMDYMVFEKDPMYSFESEELMFKIHFFVTDLSYVKREDGSTQSINVSFNHESTIAKMELSKINLAYPLNPGFYGLIGLRLNYGLQDYCETQFDNIVVQKINYNGDLFPDFLVLLPFKTINGHTFSELLNLSWNYKSEEFEVEVVEGIEIEGNSGLNQSIEATFGHLSIGNFSKSGLSDLLMRTGENEWHTFINKGGKYQHFDANIDARNISGTDRDDAMVCTPFDFDGDGIDEIYLGHEQWVDGRETAWQKLWESIWYKYDKTHWKKYQFNSANGWTLLSSEENQDKIEPGEITLGNFTGSNEVQLLKKNPSGTFTIHTCTSDEDENCINSFSNSYSESFDIDYRLYTGAVDNLRYDYPYSTLRSQFFQVVDKISNEISTTDYIFNHAVVDRCGSGFLGFEEVITTTTKGDETTKSVSQKDIFDDAIQGKFVDVKNESYINDNLIRSNSKGYGIKTSTFENNSFNYLYLSSMTEKDEETSISKAKTVVSIDNMLNTLKAQDKVLLGQNEKSITTVVSKYSPLTTPWFPSRCTTEVKTIKRNSNDYILTQRDIAYNSDGSISKITIDKEEGTSVQAPEILSTPSNFRIENSSEYDPYGNVIKESIKALSDPNIPTEKKERYIERDYYDDGLLLEWEQNQKGSGHRKSYQYYSTTGLLQQVTAPNGLVTTYYYDDYFRPEKTISADNMESLSRLYWVTSNTEDDPSNALSYSYKEVSGSGYEKVFYDKYQRELRTVVLAPGNKKLFTDTQYDAEGRLWKKSLPYFPTGTPSWIEHEYDEKGRKERIDHPDGSYTEWGYAGLVTTITTGKVVSGSDVPDRETKTTLNALGEVEKSEVVTGDTNIDKAVVNEYYTDGSLKQTSVEGITGSVTTFEYDLNGNRTKINDPSAGIITSKYNAFNELVENEDAKGTVTTYTYDELGRQDSKTITPAQGTAETVTHLYDTKKKGLLSKTTGTGGYELELEYDEYCRVVSTQERAATGEDWHNNQTEFNKANQVGKQWLDSEAYLGYSYEKETGTVNKIVFTDASTGYNKVIFDSPEYSSLGNLTNYTLDSETSIEVVNSFEAISGKFLNTSYYKGSMSEANKKYKYGLTYYDDHNIHSRQVYFNGTDMQNQPVSVNETEYFTYDKLDRLTYWGDSDIAYNETAGSTYLLNKKIDYDVLGQKLWNDRFNPASATDNAYSGEDVPDVSKSIYHPDDLTTEQNSLFPAQSISYNLHDKVSSISNTVGAVTKDLAISYRPDRSRYKTVYTEDGTEKISKYFYGGVEKEVNHISGTERKIYYLAGGDGMAAVYIKETHQSPEFYYVLQDHLGSTWALMNDEGQFVERYAYDPWGNRVNPGDWTVSDTRTALVLDRGFTGHEHLDQLGLINANGRIYDPMLGEFISPDPYVQMPRNPQNFNRYAYCLNKCIS